VRTEQRVWQREKTVVEYRRREAVLRIRDGLSRIPDPDPTIAPSRIRIPDPGGKKSTVSRILLYIKIGIKNKTNFFLAFYSFRSKFY
jgi:hypothetical protein